MINLEAWINNIVRILEADSTAKFVQYLIIGACLWLLILVARYIINDLFEDDMDR